MRQIVADVAVEFVSATVEVEAHFGSGSCAEHPLALVCNSNRHSCTETTV